MSSVKEGLFFIASGFLSSTVHVIVDLRDQARTYIPYWQVKKYVLVQLHHIFDILTTPLYFTSFYCTACITVHVKSTHLQLQLYFRTLYIPSCHITNTKSVFSRVIFYTNLTKPYFNKYHFLHLLSSSIPYPTYFSHIQYRYIPSLRSFQRRQHIYAITAMGRNSISLM